MSGLPGSDSAFCYVTTTGRRSGRPHTIEIWFAAAGPTLYVLAGGRERADWVRNLRANPTVGVRLADRQYRARARELEAGSEEDDRARRLVLGKYQAPGATDLESWGRTALAVAFDLEDPSP
ncbi:MAG TPA: nitroreductase family deazaflavin-dependent oxidoreductase [Actinomycetota bacterium]|jgi:deazaflavin-dependent oxidoreductase (nitroreductase family)|nr:nitroreductase family deazaflavin-dependent oxidoreductase [Actinomycetota bacterium]